MTLEEAIEHAEKRANEDCTDCAKEHAQLAKWLRELQKATSVTKQERSYIDFAPDGEPRCALCGNKVEDTRIKFCSECGAKMD